MTQSLALSDSDFVSEPLVITKHVRILYQNQDAVQVLCLDDDEELTVPKSSIQNMTEFFSGAECKLLLDPDWTKVFFLK